ncbi:hypothetical protein LCL97_10370 [Seohaeicola saemankumensis]|nr:hypothetical protein [Seohaeicola saemankumensis]MCA0871234.1 hypothetical protein [Seohaeicola saemankumensis]
MALFSFGLVSMRPFFVSILSASAGIAVLTAPLDAETPHSESVAESGPNILELFIGSTYADHHGHREHAFSLGASYRYSFSDVVSAGILAEYATKSLDAWVIGVPIVFNVGDGWQITTMPGVEIEGGQEEFLFRLGLGYEFEMEGGYSLKPEINADFVDGEVSGVLGISIGFRF